MYGFTILIMTFDLCQIIAVGEEIQLNFTMPISPAFYRKLRS